MPLHPLYYGRINFTETLSDLLAHFGSFYVHTGECAACDLVKSNDVTARSIKVKRLKERNEEIPTSILNTVIIILQ